eukprot:2194136-Pyramimonas_sp.AAC.2
MCSALPPGPPRPGRPPATSPSVLHSYAAPTPTSVISDPSVKTRLPGGNLRVGGLWAIGPLSAGWAPRALPGCHLIIH